MERKHHQLIILGSGPAGYTAAIYAARANIHPVVITGPQPGGQLITTHSIENWSGDVESISGFDLMERIKKHAEHYQAEIISDQIVKVELKQQPFMLIGESNEYTCDALIIATGASAKYLGLPSETAYFGKGVSGCAACDGFLYRNKNVALVGGGNTAVEEALYLSKIAAHVTVIHRHKSFNAEQILIDQLIEKSKTGNVSIEWEQEVDEVLGDENVVTGVRLKNAQNTSTKDIAVQGIFIAIGRKPNTEIFEGQIELDHGYIKVQNGHEGNVTATNIPGVFAAGDVADPFYRQAIVSAGTGCKAALDVDRYLEKQK